MTQATDDNESNGHLDEDGYAKDDGDLVGETGDLDDVFIPQPADEKEEDN